NLARHGLELPYSFSDQSLFRQVGRRPIGDTSPPCTAAFSYRKKHNVIVQLQTSSFSPIPRGTARGIDTPNAVTFHISSHIHLHTWYTFPFLGCCNCCHHLISGFVSRRFSQQRFSFFLF